MIAFKEESLRDEFCNMHEKLILIIADAHEYLVRKHKYKVMTITSIIRKDNPMSVHYYGRGCDVRSLDMKQEVIDDLLEYINGKYQYSVDEPKLKTVIHHKVPNGAYHLHFQTRF